MAGTPTEEETDVRAPGNASPPAPIDQQGQEVAETASQRQRSPSEEGEERDTNPPLPDEDAPPLPEEDAPPLPDEEPPLPAEEPPVAEDDGWEARWDASTNAYYFFNRFTLKSQWENPRVSEPSQGAPGTVGGGARSKETPPAAAYQGYNPKIHGDYDPNADYAKFHKEDEQETTEASETAASADMYAQSATFNRFTGKFQAQDRGAEYHNDDNKSKRQMSAYFDVDKAANAHDGRSLKAERAARKLSKKEAKEYNEKRRAKKEQKRRDFLMS